MHESPPAIIVEKPLSLRDILSRIALPSALFGLSLLAIVTASWSLLVPGLLTIQIGGHTHRMSDVQAYRSQLQAQLVQAEADRKDALRAVQNVQYQSLLDARAESFTAAQAEAQLNDVLARVPEPSAVRIDVFAFDPDARRVRVEGVVHGVGLRSMTVLAGWVDLLRALPTVRDLEPPQFTRIDTPDLGPHSPFRMSWRVP